MTQAQRMSELFALIPNEGPYGSKWEHHREYMALRNFVDQCRRMATNISYPLGTNSCDPTIKYTFEDGSHLTVSNGWQEYYPAYVSLN